MNRFLSYVRRTTQMPPGQAARAAWALAAARWSALRQRLAAGLGPDPLNDAAFARVILDSQGAEPILGSSVAVLPVGSTPTAPPLDLERVRTDAAQAIGHRFDLLGSGPVRVTYALEAAGVDGAVYRMAPGAVEGRRQREHMEALLPGAAADYEPIDWHVDFKSGYRWSPDAWFTRIRYGVQPGVDVKVPWELSRFQHAGALGLVHRLAPDSPEGRRAAAEFRAQVVDWIAANPLGRGVNWVCAMDVALRAVSWLIGVALLDGAPELSPAFRRLLAKGLYAHGRHIEANLEYYRDRTGNHYLSDVVGLLCIGAALPELRDSDRWCLFGLQELTSEMRRQVLDDGADIEGSVPYHHLVAELFYLGTLVGLRLDTERRARLRAVPPGRMGHTAAPPLAAADRQRFDLERAELFPDWYLDRLLGMAELAAAVTKPDGRIPQIGDHDSGRAYRLLPGRECGDGAEDPCDRRTVLAVAGRLFGRDDLAEVGLPFETDAELLVADAPTSVVRAAVERRRTGVGGGDWAARSGLTSRSHRSDDGRLELYPEGGLAVARAGPLYLAITLGRVPPFSTGGHHHNDLLAFEIQWEGVDLIVDGGSYLYTPAPELRDAFRSTEAHSTISVSGREQRVWPSGAGRLFAVRRDAEVRVLDAGSERLSAEVRYADVQHVRTWRWGADNVRIEDEVVAPAPAGFVLNLAPAVLVAGVERLGAECHEVLLDADGVRQRIRLAGVRAPEVGSGFYSLGYGRRVPTSRVVAELVAEVVTSEFTFTVAVSRARRAARVSEGP